jgi:CheY-like chemotaxis protein
MLPGYDSQGRRAEKTRPATMHPSSRILIVDDDYETAAALLDALRYSGFHVDYVADGQAALYYLQTHPRPGVILLDWHMPVMNGLQLFRAIQFEPKWTTIPIVLMTADEHAKDKAIAVRAAGYLKKPLSVEDLVTMVDSTLRHPA